LGKFRDLAGQKFGKLTAIEVIGRTHYGRLMWRCNCECGRTKDILANSLTAGRTKSCGECLYDFTGQRFGHLVVIEAAPSLNKNRRWKCRCDCGRFKIIVAWQLKNVVSCGCKTSRIDLTGQKFGRLTVLHYSHTIDQKAMWQCECECGNKPIIVAASLRSGHTKSCGCYKLEAAAIANTTHGLSGKKTRLYEIWIGMKARCFRKSHRAYKYYGGRGITVCQEWKDDFKAFYDWAFINGYEEDLSLDRIDVNGNYEPNNCKWATFLEQSRNKQNSSFIEINGEYKTIAEWSEISGVKPGTFHSRIARGWEGEELLTPAKKTKWNIRLK
jgi:hypothetical protein